MKMISTVRSTTLALTALALGIAGPVEALKVQSNAPVRLPIMQSSDFDFIVTVYGEVLKGSWLPGRIHQR